MPAGVILAGFPERGRNEARTLTRACTRARDAHTNMRSATRTHPRRSEAVIRAWLARSRNVHHASATLAGE